MIFRHLLATYTANDADSPRIPLFVKEPLLDKHWQELKTIKPELFAAAKAYYIYARAVNDFKGSDHRVNYTLANPIQAINEIEYALPHLPRYSSDKSLENALSNVIAHDWLRGAYLELFVPSRAFFHSKEIIESKTQDNNTMVKTWAYFSAIDSLLIQNKFEEALAMSNDAIEHLSTVTSVHEKLLTYVQRLRVVVFQKSEGYELLAQEVMTQIRQLDTTEVKQRTEELSAYADALYAAVLNDDAKFQDSLQRYRNIVLARKSI